MKYYDTIALMGEVLSEHKVPFTINPCHDGYQIRFPWCKGDIAMHSLTIGAREGMVETYQFPWDGDDVTPMSPLNAVITVLGYYEREHKEKKTAK